MHSIPSRRRRFTLLELMAMIAIIVILFSLLFPSVMRARHVANSAVCLSKLKQLDVATRTYAMGNRATLPVLPWGNSTEYAVNIWDVPAAFCRALAGNRGNVSDFMCSYNYSYNNSTIVRKTAGTTPSFNGPLDLSGNGKRYLVGFSYWAISFSDNRKRSVWADRNTSCIQKPRLGDLNPTKALWSDNAQGNGNTLADGWSSGASLHVFKGATNCAVVLGDGSGSLKREETLSYQRDSTKGANTWYNWY
jgi:type II secretory pathway pseudopilin PulG